MRKVLLITLALILALVGWSTVYAEDGFYVVAGQKANYAPVPKTGQTTPYGARDDGALKKGVASPTPRFTNNNNGTVTDNLTGLIWMQDAGTLGAKNWNDALTAANNLASGSGGLSDGSQAGDWRLPNLRELQSLIDYEQYNPALPLNYPFLNVQATGTNTGYYWSSTSWDLDYAWAVLLNDGYVDYAFNNGKSNTFYVWCVRGGK